MTNLLYVSLKPSCRTRHICHGHPMIFSVASWPWTGVIYCFEESAKWITYWYHIILRWQKLIWPFLVSEYHCIRHSCFLRIYDVANLATAIHWFSWTLRCAGNLHQLLSQYRSAENQCFTWWNTETKNGYINFCHIDIVLMFSCLVQFSDDCYVALLKIWIADMRQCCVKSVVTLSARQLCSPYIKITSILSSLDKAISSNLKWTRAILTLHVLITFQPQHTQQFQLRQYIYEKILILLDNQHVPIFF